MRCPVAAISGTAGTTTVLGHAMNILIIGSGGREHALAAAVASSPRVGAVAVALGNAGTLEIGQNLALDILDPAAVVEAAAYLDAGLVVVGPEAPLAAGV